MTIKQQLIQSLEARGWMFDKKITRYIVMKPGTNTKIYSRCPSYRVFVGENGGLRGTTTGLVSKAVGLPKFKQSLLKS